MRTPVTYQVRCKIRTYPPLVLISATVQIENLLALPRAKEPVVPAIIEEAASVAAPTRASSALSRAESRSKMREEMKARARNVAESISRAPTSESISTAAPRVRSGSTTSVASRASKASARSAVGRTSASPVRTQSRRVSGSTISRSQTPSPDLPDIDDAGPVTPIPAHKMKGKERAAPAGGVLGLGTPEVDEWVKAGEGNDARKEGRRVGFASQSDDEEEADDDDGAHSRASDSEDDADYQQAAPPSRPPPELAMQVSPRRSFPGPTHPGANAARWAPVPSPLRNPAPASPQARAAQDMLQALLRDALHDFRAETKQEITGLHLDLIRMGGSWRREMQEAVGGLGEELRALREENQRLREENERLRRGY